MGGMESGRQVVVEAAEARSDAISPSLCPTDEGGRKKKVPTDKSIFQGALKKKRQGFNNSEIYRVFPRYYGKAK